MRPGDPLETRTLPRLPHRQHAGRESCGPGPVTVVNTHVSLLNLQKSVKNRMTNIPGRGNCRAFAVHAAGVCTHGLLLRTTGATEPSQSESSEVVTLHL